MKRLFVAQVAWFFAAAGNAQEKEPTAILTWKGSEVRSLYRPPAKISHFCRFLADNPKARSSLGVASLSIAKVRRMGSSHRANLATDAHQRPAQRSDKLLIIGPNVRVLVGPPKTHSTPMLNRQRWLSLCRVSLFTRNSHGKRPGLRH
jgi:hypothetical protein